MKCNPWVGGSIGRRGFPMLGTGKRGLSTYIKELFSNNEQGFFYDPNDLSTMFQDSAGTVPVTDVGQAVGLVLDAKRKIGTDLVVNGDFSNGLSGWELSGGTTIFTAQNNRAYFNGAPSTSSILRQNTGLQVGKTYLVTFEFEVLQGAFYCGGTHSRTYGGRNISGSGKRQFILPVTDARDTGVSFRAENAGITCEFYIDNVSVEEITGNHAYQTTSASRPILRQNAITGAYYLEFDGSDDFLQTAAIDFTSTDKVSLFAGLRRSQTVAIVGMVSELSPNLSTNQGTFYLSAPDTISNLDTIAFSSKGTNISRAIVHDYAEPSVVVSAQSGISTATNSVRLNGVRWASSGTTQGLGNYGNHPLYIGRRGGTTMPFNGHIYGLIGIGRLTTESEIASIEKELAKRTGVTLSV